MFKKAIRVLISLVLVVTLCITTCTSAFAATSKQSYISDIVIVSAASADEAETKLKEQGYKLMSSSNLNASLEKGMYLGYKSTINRDEAITDISAMNMNGKYSFSDYEVLMKQMKENVSATIDGLVPMITRYRENYKSGAAIAVEVHDILNKFYEDDSQKYMGDYLLSCDLKDTEDITKVFMQGYSPFIVNIQQLLFLAGENKGDRNWIEKMAASDPDFLLDTYIDSYPTPNKAYTALAAKYGDVAETLKLTWNTFYENLSKIKSQYFKDNEDKAELNEIVLNKKLDDVAKEEVTEVNNKMTGSEVNAAIDETVNSAGVYDNVIDVNLITYLDSLEYGDGTMLTFFMRDAEEVDDMELYTLAYYMGSNLTAQVFNVGLQQVISRTIVDGSDTSKSDFNEINKTLAGVEEISIYDGVDRSLFENGVALTSATTQKYVSSGKSWSDDLLGRIFQPSLSEFKWTDYFAFYVLPMVACGITWFALHVVNVAIDQSIVASFAARQAGEGAVGIIKSVEEVSEKMTLIYNEPTLTRTSGPLSYLAFGKGSFASGKAGMRVLQVVKGAFFVLTVASMVTSVVMLFVTLASDDYSGPAKYSAVPNHIVDTVSTKNGNDYVAYNCVKNLSGSAGDLNNYVGKTGWLVLFYTKDQTVGAPITTDMKIVTGSSKAPLDYENITMFGEESAINLTSKDFTGVDDKAGGTYMYFNRGDVSTTASVFSNGNFAISVGAGAVAGIIIGMLLQKPNKNKKPTSA